MQYFCQRKDQGRKNRLIREIVDWLSPFCVDGSLHYEATAFYETLVNVPFFRVFVTTNWDPLLERTFDILFPIVENTDLAFWDDRRRQVLKVHGCISRPHTIVATTADYEDCLKSATRKLVFDKLRDLMATKTFVFVGYSMSDLDLRRIYDELTVRLGDFHRPPYVVDQNPSPETEQWWKERRVPILRQNSFGFALDIVERLEREAKIPSRRLSAHFTSERRRLADVHEWTSARQSSSGGIASSMYQDGLLHAIPSLMSDLRAGATWDRLLSQAKVFERQVKRHLRAVGRGNSEALFEAAYWSGWKVVYERFVSRNPRPIPAYFSPSSLKPSTRPVYFRDS